MQLPVLIDKIDRSVHERWLPIERRDLRPGRMHNCKDPMRPSGQERRLGEISTFANECAGHVAPCERLWHDGNLANGPGALHA